MTADEQSPLLTCEQILTIAKMYGQALLWAERHGGKSLVDKLFNFDFPLDLPRSYIPINLRETALVARDIERITEILDAHGGIDGLESTLNNVPPPEDPAARQDEQDQSEAGRITIDIAKERDSARAEVRSLKMALCRYSLDQDRTLRIASAIEERAEEIFKEIQ